MFVARLFLRCSISFWMQNLAWDLVKKGHASFWSQPRSRSTGWSLVQQPQILGSNPRLGI
jgi:hypothetical protein